LQKPPTSPVERLIQGHVLAGRLYEVMIDRMSGIFVKDFGDTKPDFKGHSGLYPPSR
jgi:hypothetical protein